MRTEPMLVVFGAVCVGAVGSAVAPGSSPAVGLVAPDIMPPAGLVWLAPMTHELLGLYAMVIGQRLAYAGKVSKKLSLAGR